MSEPSAPEPRTGDTESTSEDTDGPETAAADDLVRATVGTRPSLVVFRNDSCDAVMRQLSDTLEKIAGDGVNVVTIDVDEHAETAERHRIWSLPTFAVYRDGEYVTRRSGATGPDDLTTLAGRARS